MEIHQIVQNQREYFASSATRTSAFRLEALRKLQKSIRDYEPVFAEAMATDFNKPPFEVYMTEIGMVLDEIGFHLKHLPRWIRNRSVPTPLAHFHAKSFVVPEPYGIALIMSPWNYPIQLCLEPLVGAISGGNCSVIKSSAYVPNTSNVIADLIGKTFDPRYIAVIEGGREQNKALLEEQFDYIFFTGSVTVGKLVMQSGKTLNSCNAGTGRQEPRHRGQDSQHQNRGKAYSLRQGTQRRSDLCGAGLSAAP